MLLLWFYLTGASVLMGGEINSVLENAAAVVLRHTLRVDVDGARNLGLSRRSNRLVAGSPDGSPRRCADSCTSPAAMATAAGADSCVAAPSAVNEPASAWARVKT